MYFFGLLIGHQKPSRKFLNRYVRDAVGPKWHDLGIELLDFDDYEQKMLFTNWTQITFYKQMILVALKNINFVLLNI